MHKFIVFNFIISYIFCASLENSESSWSVRPLIACDLSVFNCTCGDIDVVKCKCIEWPKDCPQNTTFDSSSCKCLGEDGLEHAKRSVQTVEINSESNNSGLSKENGNGTGSKSIDPNSSSSESVIVSSTSRPMSDTSKVSNNGISSSSDQSLKNPTSSLVSNPYNLSSGLKSQSSSTENLSSGVSSSVVPEKSSSNVKKTSSDNPTLSFISKSLSNDSCIIPECRPCDELDEVNCICYQVILDCLPGYINSPDGCDCIRDNSTSVSNVCPGLVCTDGLKVNEAYCNCTHKVCNEPVQQCKKDWLFDLETCQCVCGLRDWNCQRFFQVDPVKCVCSPPPCVPFSKCPKGTAWDSEECTCYCTNPPNCTADIYVVDNRTCECVCPKKDCDVGFIVDKLTCECVPEHVPECPPRFVYDPFLCRCVCETFHECPYNFEWDEHVCKCICPKSVVCDADFIWSDQQCDCVCNAKKTCQANFIFDQKACDCVCDPKFNDTGCDVGFMFDRKICSCVKGARPHCPAGFVYSEDECGCVCAVVEKCHGKGIFDHDTCKCVCLENTLKHSCVNGYFSSDECDCVVKSFLLDLWNGEDHEDWIN